MQHAASASARCVSPRRGAGWGAYKQGTAPSGPARPLHNCGAVVVLGASEGAAVRAAAVIQSEAKPAGCGASRWRRVRLDGTRPAALLRRALGRRGGASSGLRSLLRRKWGRWEVRSVASDCCDERLSIAGWLSNSGATAAARPPTSHGSRRRHGRQKAMPVRRVLGHSRPRPSLFSPSFFLSH